MRVRSIAASLAFLVTTTLVAASPAGAIGGFGDVEAGRYYTRAVQWMVDGRITTGTSPTCFSPDGLVTRGQAAAFLHRMEGEPEAGQSHPFDDVTLGWQVDAVAWLHAEGITTGTTPTTYSPNALVSRGEVAALVHRLAGEPEAAAHPFSDVVRPWQTVPVAWMYGAGITTGTSASTFSPNLPVTRAQFATFLYRYAEQPPVSLDPAGPSCDDGSATRQVTETDYGVFATVGPLEIRLPASRVELIGYHEATHDGAQGFEPAVNDVRTTTLGSRSRGTHSRSAADVVVDPAVEIRSPVTGTVVRGGGYTLYCDHRDEFVVIAPDDRPGWEVSVLHFEGLAVSPGDRVVAGETVIARNATILPFVSQVDDLTASPSWPHVHLHVIDPSIPDRPSSGGGC